MSSVTTTYPIQRVSMLAANVAASLFLREAAPRPTYQTDSRVTRAEPQPKWSDAKVQYERWWAAQSASNPPEDEALSAGDRFDPFYGSPFTRWAKDAGGDVFAAYFPSPPPSDSAFADWGHDRGLQECIHGCEAHIAPEGTYQAGCEVCLGYGFAVALDRRTQYRYDSSGRRLPRSASVSYEYRECECTLYPHDAPCRVCFGCGFVFSEASPDKPQYRSPRATLSQLRDFATAQRSRIRARGASRAPEVDTTWLAHNWRKIYRDEQRRWANLIDHDLGTAYRATAGGERIVNLRIASVDYVTCTTCHGSAKRRDGKPCFCNAWRTPPGTTPAHTQWAACSVNPDTGIYVSNMGEYIGPEWFTTNHPDPYASPFEVMDTLSERPTTPHWPGNHVRLYYTEVYWPGPFVLRPEMHHLTPCLGPLGELFSHPGVDRQVAAVPYTEEESHAYDAPDPDSPLDGSDAG